MLEYSDDNTIRYIIISRVFDFNSVISRAMRAIVVYNKIVFVSYVELLYTAYQIPFPVLRVYL